MHSRGILPLIDIKRIKQEKSRFSEVTISVYHVSEQKSVTSIYKITGCVAGGRFFSRAASIFLLSDCIFHVVSPEICLLELEIIKKIMQNIAYIYVNRKHCPF